MGSGYFRESSKNKVRWSDLKKPKRVLTPEQKLARAKTKAAYVAGAIWMSIFAVTITVLSVVF
jgi:hypothetical protein